MFIVKHITTMSHIVVVSRGKYNLWGAVGPKSAFSQRIGLKAEREPGSRWTEVLQEAHSDIIAIDYTFIV